MVGNKSVAGSDRRGDMSASDAASKSSATAGAEPNSKGENGIDTPNAGENGKEMKVSKGERRAEFRRLVEGEYKDIYESEFQKQLERRLRGVRETEERMSKVTPLIDTLMARYDIENNDIAALTEAVNRDRGYWESAADEAGMTVEQYQQFLKYKSDSQRYDEMRMEQERDRAVRQQLDAWNDAARSVREVYPDFDINDMADRPEFISMLRAGVPMKHAYEVLNIDGIKNLAAKNAAEAAEKNIVEGIRAKGTRPRENGTSSQSGITTGLDISKLSERDIKNMLARARNGETITFK